MVNLSVILEKRAKCIPKGFLIGHVPHHQRFQLLVDNLKMYGFTKPKRNRRGPVGNEMKLLLQLTRIHIPQ